MKTLAQPPHTEGAVEPFFLDSPDGPLYAIYRGPAEGVKPRGNLLCCMPFNEEMNRCRSMVTLQAQTLAARGYGTLLLDLLGTGDSAGDYRDGRWQTWVDNLQLGKNWLAQHRGGCSALLGIRLGAMLAADLHARLANPALGLVFWQPVLDGKTHLTQFMRVRIAADLDRRDGPKETTATMRQRWQDGGPVEIAGYELHPALAQSLDMLAMGNFQLPPGTQLLWLEQSVDAGNAVGTASKRLLDSWPGPKVQTTVTAFDGPAFWQLFDRVLAPSVVAATTAWLTDGGRA